MAETEYNSWVYNGLKSIFSDWEDPDREKALERLEKIHSRFKKQRGVVSDRDGFHYDWMWNTCIERAIREGEIPEEWHPTPGVYEYDKPLGEGFNAAREMLKKEFSELFINP